MTVSSTFSKGIMIVEDDPGRLRLIAAFLKQSGFVPLPVRSFEQALEMLTLITPDLAIINGDVDGMGGADLCREVRMLAPSPILLLGWRNGLPLQTEILIDDFLTLPFVGYELINKVKNLLGCKQTA